MAQINIHEDMIKCALHLKIESTITSKTVKAKLLELRVFFVFFVRVVTPQNVILTQNVITLTQNVIKFSTQNVIIIRRKL